MNIMIGYLGCMFLLVAMGLALIGESIWKNKDLFLFFWKKQQPAVKKAAANLRFAILSRALAGRLYGAMHINRILGKLRRSPDVLHMDGPFRR